MGEKKDKILDSGALEGWENYRNALIEYKR